MNTLNVQETDASVAKAAITLSIAGCSVLQLCSLCHTEVWTQSALCLESISFMRVHHLGHNGSGCVTCHK